VIAPPPTTYTAHFHCTGVVGDIVVVVAGVVVSIVDASVTQVRIPFKNVHG